MIGVIGVTLAGKLILHRAYPGGHEEFSACCWCGPMLVESDDPRSTAEIQAALEAMKRVN